MDILPLSRDLMTATARHIPIGDWQSYDVADTFVLGKHIGTHLSGGEILLLDGPLGAGKTIFAKGLASALDIDPEEVTSPSFTLVNPHVGRLSLFHIDLYRLEEGANAAYAIDLDELLADEQAVVIIEWAERLGRYPLPANIWRIKIIGDGEAPRRISISG